MFETFLTPILQKEKHTLTKICLRTNQKVYMAILNVVSMLKDLLKSQAIMFAVQVVISLKQFMIVTLLDGLIILANTCSDNCDDL